jgi:hypothetical protein
MELSLTLCCDVKTSTPSNARTSEFLTYGYSTSCSPILLAEYCIVSTFFWISAENSIIDSFDGRNNFVSFSGWLYHECVGAVRIGDYEQPRFAGSRLNKAEAYCSNDNVLLSQLARACCPNIGDCPGYCPGTNPSNMTMSRPGGHGLRGTQPAIQEISFDSNFDRAFHLVRQFYILLSRLVLKL